MGLREGHLQGRDALVEPQGVGHRQEVELGHATPVEGHREVVPADTADIEAEEELVDASVVYVVVS